MSFCIIVSCATHPRYKALKAPTADCEDCRQMYEIRREVKHRADLPHKREVVKNPQLQCAGPRDFCSGTVIRPWLIKAAADTARSGGSAS